MLHLDFWQALGIVCGALAALLALLGLIYRWLVRPVIRIIRRLNEVADLLLGEPARGDRPARPSMAERMSTMERLLNEHLASHGGPGPGRGRGRVNGPRPTPTGKA